MLLDDRISTDDNFSLKKKKSKESSVKFHQFINILLKHLKVNIIRLNVTTSLLMIKFN